MKTQEFTCALQTTEDQKQACVCGGSVHLMFHLQWHKHISWRNGWLNSWDWLTTIPSELVVVHVHLRDNGITEVICQSNVQFWLLLEKQFQENPVGTVRVYEEEKNNVRSLNYFHSLPPLNTWCQYKPSLQLHSTVTQSTLLQPEQTDIRFFLPL